MLNIKDFKQKDDKLLSYKKPIFTSYIQNNFKTYLFGKNRNININQIMQYVEVRIQNNFEIPQPQKIESKNEIPDNVIRIETQDGSGAFIEIILPKEQENNIEDIGQDNNLWHTAREVALDIGLGILSRGKYKPKSKTTKKSTSIKPKSLSREEVINLLKNKYKLKTSKELKKEGYKNIRNSDNVYWARDNKQIRIIGKDFIKDSTYIGKSTSTININGKIEKVKVNTYLSKDEALKINIRDNSKSGGSTVDLVFKNDRDITIHNLKDKR